MLQSMGSQRVGHDLVTEQQCFFYIRQNYLKVIGKSMVPQQSLGALFTYDYTVKSQSVSCSVISDSVRPHGL